MSIFSFDICYCGVIQLKNLVMMGSVELSGGLDADHAQPTGRNEIGEKGKANATPTLRRSRATHLLARGVDLATVSGFLRHKRLETTMLYLKLTPEFVYRKIEDKDPLGEEGFI